MLEAVSGAIALRECTSILKLTCLDLVVVVHVRLKLAHRHRQTALRTVRVFEVRSLCGGRNDILNRAFPRANKRHSFWHQNLTHKFRRDRFALGLPDFAANSVNAF